MSCAVFLTVSRKKIPKLNFGYEREKRGKKSVFEKAKCFSWNRFFRIRKKEGKQQNLEGLGSRSKKEKLRRTKKQNQEVEAGIRIEKQIQNQKAELRREGIKQKAESRRSKSKEQNPEAKSKIRTKRPRQEAERKNPKHT